MKTRLIVSFISLLTGVAFQACDTALNVEQPSTKYFTKFYSGVLEQRGADMVVGPDFSTYILGTTTTALGEDGDDQVYVAMVDREGNLVWQKELGGPDDEEAKDIELTIDGNLAIVANVREGSTDNRNVSVFVINPTAPETVLYSRVYGYAGFDENANSITEVSDGFIVSGTTTRVNVLTGPTGILNPENTTDGFYFRFNDDLSNYALPWEERYGTDSDPDVIIKTIEFSPGLFYVFGNTSASDVDGIPDQNIWVFTASNSGGVSANNVIIPNSLIPQTTADNNERVTSVARIPGQQGFLLTGYTSANGAQRIFVVTIRSDFKTKDNALLHTPKLIEGTSPISSTAMASGYPAPSGFLIVGVENSIGDENILLTKVDPLDLSLPDAWAQPRERFFLGGEGQDVPAAVVETHDQRILVLGTMVLGGVTGQQKISLMKLSPRGMFGE